MILCGGYPELYAEALSANQSMPRWTREAVAGGMPLIAECGEFLSLHDLLKNVEDGRFPMAGVIPGEAFPAHSLVRFGYVTLTADREKLLCETGGKLRAHEFHSSQAGRQELAARPHKCDHVCGFPVSQFLR